MTTRSLWLPGLIRQRRESHKFAYLPQFASAFIFVVHFVLPVWKNVDENKTAYYNLIPVRTHFASIVNRNNHD